MLPPRQPARRTPPSEEAILEESRQHSHRLGKIAIDASNASWRQDEAERTARHSFGAARREAFARLDAQNASHDAALHPGPAVARVTHFHPGLTAAGLSVARGAVTGLVLFGLLAAARPYPTAAEPIAPAPILTPAETAQARALLERGLAAALRALGDAGACDDTAVLIHPVWRD